MTNLLRSTIAALLCLVAVEAHAEFRGAFVHKTTQDQPQEIGSDFYGTSGEPWHRVEFSAVDYDTGSFFDAKNNQFVIPAGVKFVRLSGQIVFGHSAIGARQTLITKNNALFNGYAAQNASSTPGTTPDMNVVTAVLPVKEGDTFQLQAWQVQTDQNEKTTLNPSGGTWFSIEVVE